MVELADGHVDTTHATNGANGTNKRNRTRSTNGTNGAHGINGINGINGTSRKRIVVVGLGMVAVAFMYDLTFVLHWRRRANRHAEKS